MVAPGEATRSLGRGLPGFAVSIGVLRSGLPYVGAVSTALHLCYVTMGALDLVHDHRAALVDIAGAAAVVLEAGGVLTGVDGSPVFPARREHLAGEPLAILAGNRASHAQALADVPYLMRA